MESKKLGRPQGSKTNAYCIVRPKDQCMKCGSTNLIIKSTISREDCEEVHNGLMYTKRIRRLSKCQKCGQNIMQIVLEN